MGSPTQPGENNHPFEKWANRPPASHDWLCALPTWWFWRGGCTRSHSEHGRETPQRRWYFVSRHGRVGRCQVCKTQNPIILIKAPYRRQNTNRRQRPEKTIGPPSKRPIAVVRRIVCRPKPNPRKGASLTRYFAPAKTGSSDPKDRIVILAFGQKQRGVEQPGSSSGS